MRRLSLRSAQVATLACLIPILLGASGTTRFQRLGHQMMCPCGCAEILLECNHVGCPDSDRMIGELRSQLAGGGGGSTAGGGTGGDLTGTIPTSGGTDTSILNWFAAKYGATVLAAPIRGGFDNVAWIAPFAVFFLATIGTAVVIRVWKLRASPVPALVHNPEADALRARIRRETQY